jgi:hypothetical protein
MGVLSHPKTWYAAWAGQRITRFTRLDIPTISVIDLVRLIASHAAEKTGAKTRDIAEPIATQLVIPFRLERISPKPECKQLRKARSDLWVVIGRISRQALVAQRREPEFQASVILSRD